MKAAAPRPASRLTRRAVAAFGLRINRTTHPAAGHPHHARHKRDIQGALATAPPGGIILLAGPSGSGKSARLAAAARFLGTGAVTGTPPATGSRSVIDLVGPGDLRQRLARLVRVGLGEPALAARPAAALSQGERARLEIAIALARAQAAPGAPTRWMLVDEFCSALDRPTAAVVAASTHRALRAGPAHVGLIAATAHADIETRLSPDIVVRCHHDGAATTERRHGRRPRALTIRIAEGTIRDYDRLAPHHYLAGRPATHERVLVARASDDGPALGVLVVSRPVLNARWRAAAWPGRFTPGASLSPSLAARRINRELRCISRVIVDPRVRGCGVASKLVRAYLADPLTPMTESVAAMGWVCPFFERAGMTAWPLARRASDERLVVAIQEAGHEPEDLIDDEVATEILGDAALRRAITTWGRAVGAALPKPLRARLHDTEALLHAAAVRVAMRPVAYSHTAE